MIFAIKAGGAYYGWSRSFVPAYQALERGRARGFKSGEVVVRKRPVPGLKADEWLAPFARA